MCIRDSDRVFTVRCAPTSMTLAGSSAATGRTASRFPARKQHAVSDIKREILREFSEGRIHDIAPEESISMNGYPFEHQENGVMNQQQMKWLAETSGQSALVLSEYEALNFSDPQPARCHHHSVRQPPAIFRPFSTCPAVPATEIQNHTRDEQMTMPCRSPSGQNR